MTMKQIIAIGIVVLAIIVILQNLAVAQISILFISISMPVAVLCLVMFVLGVLAGGMLARTRVSRPV